MNLDLNQFSTVDIVLDKANDNIIQKQTISAGDRDGRSLTLQVTNEGSIGEVPGLTANLLWTNHSSGVSDLSDFSVVDRTTSVFKINYPQNMLTAGKVTAQIQLLHNGKVTHSKKFEIIVLDIAGKLKGVLQTAEYTALVEALAKTNEFETEIAEVTAQLAQTEQELEETKIDLHYKRDKSVPIIMSDLHTSVKEKMTGGSVAVVGENSVRSENIVDNEVLARNVSFVKAGKNKFDGRYVRGAISGGNDSVYQVSENDFYSAIVKVEPNKTYTISKHGGNRFRTSASTHYPQHNDAVRYMFSADTTNQQTITTLDNEHYIIIYVSASSVPVPDWLQVEEGSQVTGYERQKVIVDLDKNAVNMNMIENGSMNAFLSGQSACFNVDTENKVIHTLGEGGFVSIGNRLYNLKNGTFDYSLFPFNSVVVVFDIRTSDIKFYAVDSQELLESKNEYAILGVLRLNEESYALNGIFRVNGSPVKPFTLDVLPDTPKRPAFLMPDIVSEPYTPITPFIHTSNSKINDLYAIYDSLVNDFPDYVSRVLGTNEYTGLPIYKYKFKPSLPQGSDLIPEYRHPKIIITNLHGHEKQAAFSSARFFKDLCENWSDNDTLSLLRWNAEIDVVPIVSPWGFNNDSRLNSRGVDINRNFPTGWLPTYTDINYDFPGTSAASEIETQYILSLMTDGGYDLVLDHHQYGGLLDSTHAFYYNSRDAKIKAVLSSIAQSFMPFLKKTFPGIPNNNVSIVRVAGGEGVDNALGYTEWHEKGVKSVLLETGVSVGADGTIEDVQKMQSYIVGNSLAKLIQHYDWLL